MPYKDPEKNRIAARDSMRKARATTRATRELVHLVSDGPLIPIRQDSVSHSMSLLASIMVDDGLTPKHIISKIKQRMDSETLKRFGEENLRIEDNDAQLKATELAIDMASRAGLLPSAKSNSSSGQITVNIISTRHTEPQVIELKEINQE